MKDCTIALALTCLLSLTFCATVRADGFKLPTFSNPFKKPATSTSPAPARRPPAAAGTGVSGSSQPAANETSSFSFPKPKLPKFELPSFARDKSEASASRTSPRSTSTRQTTNRTTVTQQSRSNQNRPSQPSTLDKFSQGTKNFFGKAKTTLMPWTDNTTAPSSQRPSAPSGSGSLHAARANTGTRTASRSNSPAADGEANKGWSFPWSKPQPEVDNEIRTTNDFLSLERPKY